MRFPNRTQFVVEFVKDGCLQSENFRILAVGFIVGINQFEGLIDTAAKGKQLGEFDPRANIGRIKAQDRLQTSGQVGPLLLGFFDLGEAAPCRQQILVKPQRISQFDDSFRIITVFGQLYAVFVVVLRLPSPEIYALKTKKHLHR